MRVPLPSFPRRAVALPLVCLGLFPLLAGTPAGAAPECCRPNARFVGTAYATLDGKSAEATCKKLFGSAATARPCPPPPNMIGIGTCKYRVGTPEEYWTFDYGKPPASDVGPYRNACTTKGGVYEPTRY